MEKMIKGGKYRVRPVAYGEYMYASLMDLSGLRSGATELAEEIRYRIRNRAILLLQAMYCWF